MNMKHEKSRIVWFFGIIISIVIIGVGFAVDEYTPIIKIFGFVVLIASYVQAYIFCRCPYCSHSFLTLSGWGGVRLIIEMPKFCPDCGKEVN